MLEMLLSEWIVRFFFLYLFVAGSVALIRHQKRAVASTFVCLPILGIGDRWRNQGDWHAARRTARSGQYNIKDKRGIRTGYGERNSSQFWKESEGVRYR